MNWTLNRIQIKGAARKSLSGNWIKGILLSCAVVVVTMFCTYFFPLSAPQATQQIKDVAQLTPEQLLSMLGDMLIPNQITDKYIGLVLICVALFLLLVPPLKMGLREFFQRVYRGEKPQMRVAFSWYANFGKIFGAIGLSVYVAILSVLWGALIMLVPLAVLALAAAYSAPMLTLLGNALYIAAMFLLALKLTSYMPAAFLYAGKPESGIFKAVRTSVRITRGRRRECFVFQLSFLLWNLLSLFNTIARAFVDTYYLTACAGFVDYLAQSTSPAQAQPEPEE